MRKLVCIFAGCFILLWTLSACENPMIVMLRPTSQAGSVWASMDGVISFETQGPYSARGTMQLDGETMEIYVDFDYGSAFYIYPIEVLEDPLISEKRILETLSCSFESDERFTAVVEKTTYLKEGQTFTFYRISP